MRVKFVCCAACLIASSMNFGDLGCCRRVQRNLVMGYHVSSLWIECANWAVRGGSPSITDDVRHPNDSTRYRHI